MASLKAEIIRNLLFLTGLKKAFSSSENFQKKLDHERAKGPDKPKRKFLRAFDVEEYTDHGYRVFTISPKSGNGSDHHVLYLHGGGYVLDVAWAHWDFIARLITTTGATVTLPVYPLAPETKCAELIPQMQSLFTDLTEIYGAENITVMGDSAGGGLSLTLGQVMRDTGGPHPGRLILLSPWLDANANDPSQPEIETRDVMLGINGLHFCANAYRGDLDLDHPWISPLFGELHDLPPIQIFAGTDDILLPDSRRLSERLKAEGIEHDYHEYPDMYHVWMLIDMKESRHVMSAITNFMNGTAG